MSDRKMNIIRACICIFISMCCFGIGALGIADDGAKFPYIGGGLCLFLAIAYIRQALDR